MPLLIKSIHWRLVFKYVAKIIFPLGLSTFIPGFYALFLGNSYLFLLFILVGFLIFTLTWILLHLIPEKDFKFRDGLIIVAISYLIGSFFAAIPFIFGGELLWIDAFFEAISGFTTTGFTMVNPDKLPTPLILWRSLIQWIGGVGFVLLSVGFLISPGSPMARLFVPETKEEGLPLSLNQMAAVTVKIYIIFTIIGIILLLISGLSLLTPYVSLFRPFLQEDFLLM